MNKLVRSGAHKCNGKATMPAIDEKPSEEDQSNRKVSILLENCFSVYIYIFTVVSLTCIISFFSSFQIEIEKSTNSKDQSEQPQPSPKPRSSTVDREATQVIPSSYATLDQNQGLYIIAFFMVLMLR